MKLLRLSVLAACLLFPVYGTVAWVGAARHRLAAVTPGHSEDQVAVAASSDEGYCNGELRTILRRVLQSCGLVGTSGARGCQPVEAKNVATVSGSDFNALFRPMKDRGGIIQFEQGKSDLDANDTALIDKVFSDQRGASYFFVVARASPEGSTAANSKLSEARANAVMQHLRDTFHDPDLDKEVGLLWLGEEFAQLDTEFCQWRRSGPADACDPKDINRSAFIAWIDCRL